MNDLNILDAMAERLKSVVPPVGYALRNVYATPPEALPVVQSIVFFPGDDTVSIGSFPRFSFSIYHGSLNERSVLI